MDNWLYVQYSSYMILYIAEKPSLGRAIAEALPGSQRKADGCIYLANGDCVSWCVGHLLEQAEPDAYNPDFKKWRMEQLPIIPEQWQLRPKSESRKQLAVLRKLVKEADTLVHAGDPDREGQLLVDQLIDFLKVAGKKRESIQRCLISDLNPSAVRRAIAQMRANSEFKALSVSALARSRADWLYGINMTRAYTLQGRKVGYDGVLSVGRVQTPLLGLVVERDREIKHFVSKPFFQVIAHIDAGDSGTFKAKWQPSDNCQPYMDEDGRVLSKPLAQNVVARIANQPATLVSSHCRNKTQPPPLPYNLSNLQIDGAKRFGLSAKQVLDSCQSLYERHKLLTYPRSDSRYLPAQHFDSAASVLAALADNCDTLTAAVKGSDTTLKSKAWNDAKVQAHHAIIPTEKKANLAKLTVADRNIYELVARQYIAQFYPPYEYADSEIKLDIAKGLFIAKARQPRKQGWKCLFPSKSAAKPSDDLALNSELPSLSKDDRLMCLKGELLEKQTSPAKPFDDATLLAAMTGIARYVSDKALRAILKETDGLGTEATRAGIIELLFKRGFLIRSGKQIRASAAGTGLIEGLPERATKPDMTARWEMELDDISQKKTAYQHFMQPLQLSLGTLIEQCQGEQLLSLKGLKSEFKGSAKRRPRSSSKNKSTATKRATTRSAASR